MINNLRTLFLIVFISLACHANAQKITDTIFYNSQWQICEKPIASYYRIGTLMVDSNWYYSGPFKDYSLDGKPQMEGAYSFDGFKEGPFRFFDTEGNLMVTGNYKNDKPCGEWEWKFTNGVTRAAMHFIGSDNDIEFTFFRDDTGKVLLENGNGQFIWNVHAFEDMPLNILVKGQYENGKRSGTWKYYRGNEPGLNTKVCEEKYTEEGVLKKAKIISRYDEVIHRKCFEYDFVPRVLKVTERMTYDRLFAKGADSIADKNLLNYLRNRNSINIIIKNKKFDDAILYILTSLESNRNYFDYLSKDIDGKIEFKVGDSSRPEDISIICENITEKEKTFLLYLMSKFNNIEMPVDGTIGIEGYHTIYFFSFDIKKYLPADLQQYGNKELFFTLIPKDKYELFLNANKKAIKKALRSEVLRYR
jgi:antitoxin component YwqK of YwqJK toxin-antitoxin module